MIKKGSHSQFNITEEGCRLVAELGQDYIKDFFSQKESSKLSVSFDAFLVCLGISIENFIKRLLDACEGYDSKEEIERVRELFTQALSHLALEAVNEACNEKLKKMG